MTASLAAVGIAELQVGSLPEAEARRRRRRRGKKRCKTVGGKCSASGRRCCAGLACETGAPNGERCCRRIQSKCGSAGECCADVACAAIEPLAAADKQGLAGTRCCLEFGASCTRNEDCCGTLFCNANVNNTCD